VNHSVVQHFASVPDHSRIKGVAVVVNENEDPGRFVTGKDSVADGWLEAAEPNICVGN